MHNQFLFIVLDDVTDGDAKRKQQSIQRSGPAEMTPAGKYFTDFKTLYHYQQEQRFSIQKCMPKNMFFFLQKLVSYNLGLKLTLIKIMFLNDFDKNGCKLQ